MAARPNIDALRTDACKHLLALHVDTDLQDAVALANTANQIIAVLSASSKPAVKIDPNLPRRIDDFTADQKAQWCNGQWHALVCGVDFGGSTSGFTGMIYTYAKTIGRKAMTRTYGETVKFCIHADGAA